MVKIKSTKVLWQKRIEPEMAALFQAVLDGKARIEVGGVASAVPANPPREAADAKANYSHPMQGMPPLMNSASTPARQMIETCVGPLPVSRMRGEAKPIPKPGQTK